MVFVSVIISFVAVEWMKPKQPAVYKFSVAVVDHFPS